MEVRLAQRSCRGFTLMEMVLVSLVVGVVAAALVPMAFSALQTYFDASQRVAALDKLRYATERIARELREVAYNDGVNYNKDGTPFADKCAQGSFATGSFSFVGTLGADTVSFYRPFRDGGGALLRCDTVSIARSGSTVTLGYSGYPGTGAQVLVDEVTAFSLTYIGGATASTVRRIQISLSIRHDGKTYTQETQVELKNYSVTTPS